MAQIDFSPFISKIAIGGVVLAVVSIAATIAVVLVARTGAGQALGMLFNKFEQAGKEKSFQDRYRREKRNCEYRTWKKNKGLF